MALNIDSLTASQIASALPRVTLPLPRWRTHRSTPLRRVTAPSRPFCRYPPSSRSMLLARIDAARAAGEALPLLAGVPLAIKDNMNLVGTRTTCASRMLENYESVYTATCVERMLQAGCLPMGKANMDEFAFGSSTESSAFHRTNNPWDTERVPGGSSGGSAAAVAAARSRFRLAPTRADLFASRRLCAASWDSSLRTVPFRATAWWLLAPRLIRWVPLAVPSKMLPLP